MTLYLVRHASAGVRGHLPDDTARPLDEHGRSQAQAIARFLDDQPIELVLSSRAARCIETVQPLASAHRLEVQSHPSLFEGSPGHDALDLLEHLATDGREGVLCSHGDVIPDVLQLLVNRGLELGTERGFAKGSMWIIETDGAKPTVARYAPSESMV